jgi:HAD superfamily hydrolase (TIGR01458 family)
MDIKPILIDFDGVIKIADSPAPDADEFFHFINENKIPACILSNSTLRTGDMIRNFFLSHGIDLQIPALTAFDAAVSYVKQNYNRVKVYCRDYLIKHFEGMIDQENPEAVVIGDIEDKWNYQIMNDIFLKVFGGADLVAMHKNKYWNPHGKLLIDAGAFINGIEYSTNKEAVLIGKPSRLYFETAINKLNRSAEDGFYMIGDDVENDVLAAQKIGGTGVLIYTGKTEFPLNIESVEKPDIEVHSLKEVIELLKKYIN